MQGSLEFGLVSSDFEEGSEKQGFTVNQTMLGQGNNSITEYINESYLEEWSEARAIIVAQIIRKRQMFSMFTACMVTVFLSVLRQVVLFLSHLITVIE